MLKLKKGVKLWLVYALLAFPSFYFVYKFGDPNFGCKDFFDYYPLFKNFDIQGVDAPFNMRLLSSFFVNLFYNMGFGYDTKIAFETGSLDQRIFFCAIFFNYLCVVTTCVAIYKLLSGTVTNGWIAFVGGIVYLLGFGTLFYELMPITDALSILLFAIVLLYYKDKKLLVIVPLLLLIIQREYIFLALGLVALLDLWKFRNRYYLHVLLMCIACFAIYFVLRKTTFYTPKYDHQASPAFFASSLFKLKFPLLPYLKQVLMTLNIFILYVLVVAYKRYKKMPINGFEFVKILLLFVQINLISFAAVFGNNTGRYFYILVPLVIFQLIIESKDFFSHER
jgi:hypothetical protein